MRDLQILLPDQGSNLDFPESKSGVLPVTPSGNPKLPWKARTALKRCAKVELFSNCEGRLLNHFAGIACSFAGFCPKATDDEVTEGLLRRRSALGHLAIFGSACLLDKALSPEPVFVQDGDHRILEVALVAEVNAAVQGGGVALPDGAVLAAVEELYQ